VLIVELRRAKGRDEWHRVRGREAVRDEMYGQIAEHGRISGHGDRVSEWARNTRRLMMDECMNSGPNKRYRSPNVVR
jgi:hypothetical protein